ncbi:13174_t:CDS:2 [Acaulospora colombiana]|uniref:13174_t:CDS:1 n=1 Tax=Acaulospora colombiana TaxID=27376 RepID=A0ACA9K803_9GLOM|nr:13174_t:CDS:2 [Acaulospora colombiana]
MKGNIRFIDPSSSNKSHDTMNSGRSTSVTPRWGHTATLVNNTIYFIGGKSNIDLYVTDFLALSVSTSFSISSPPWIPLNNTQVPFLVGHTATPGDVNNSKILIFGGSLTDPGLNFSSIIDFIPKFYVYDPPNDSWLVPNLSIFSNGPSRRYQHSAVTLGVQTDSKWVVGNVTDDDSENGQMIIYGGYVDDTTGSPTANILEDFWGMNSVNMDTWVGYPVLESSPGRLCQHTASVINKTKMVVLGGVREDGLMSMATVYVYDFVKLTWSNYTVTGQVPAPRRDHSAVVSGPRIIIYGGADLNGTTIYNDAAELDTTTWKWSAQPTINTPPGRFQHTATLIGANMIVGFGKTNVDFSTADNNIYILNVINWTWVDTYVPTVLVNYTHPELPPHTVSPGSLSRGELIGIVVSGSILILNGSLPPSQSSPNRDGDLENGSDDGSIEDGRGVRGRNDGVVARRGNSLGKSVRRDKTSHLGGDENDDEEINIVYREDITSASSDSPSSSSPAKFLRPSDNNDNLVTITSSDDNLLTNNVLLNTTKPIASHRRSSSDSETLTPASGVGTVRRRSVKFNETPITIDPIKYDSVESLVISAADSGDNDNSIAVEDEDRGGPSNSRKFGLMNFGGKGSDGEGKRLNFPGLKRSSLSLIFRRNSGDSGKGEGKVVRRNSASGSVRSNPEEGGSRSRDSNRHLTVDENPDSRSSFDSVDIRNIGVGLDIQRASVGGDSIIVTRNRLRAVNPDEREDSNSETTEEEHEE